MVGMVAPLVLGLGAGQVPPDPVGHLVEEELGRPGLPVDPFSLHHPFVHSAVAEFQYSEWSDTEITLFTFWKQSKECDYQIICSLLYRVSGLV